MFPVWETGNIGEKCAPHEVSGKMLPRFADVYWKGPARVQSQAAGSCFEVCARFLGAKQLFNKERFQLAENLRSARWSPFIISKVLAARMRKLITARKDHLIPLLLTLVFLFNFSLAPRCKSETCSVSDSCVRYLKGQAWLTVKVTTSTVLRSWFTRQERTKVFLLRKTEGFHPRKLQGMSDLEVICSVNRWYMQWR